MTDPDEIGPPSAWFEAHREAIAEGARLGRVLDVACGRGRHALAAARAGLEVLAIDRQRASLDTLEAAAASLGCAERIETRTLDLEGPTPPELGAERFGVVLVARYLHRPLAAWLEERLAHGGRLLYETFTTRQRDLGWGPSRDAFLLRPGELEGLFPGLEVVAFEEGPSADANPAETARLLARKPADAAAGR